MLQTPSVSFVQGETLACKDLVSLHHDAVCNLNSIPVPPMSVLARSQAVQTPLIKDSNISRRSYHWQYSLPHLVQFLIPIVDARLSVVPFVLTILS
jgi:hypothetical protein